MIWKEIKGEKYKLTVFILVHLDLRPHLVVLCTNKNFTNI